MRQLIIERDPSSIPTYATELSDEAWTGRLALGAELQVTVPAGAVYAIISSDDYVWMKADGGITFPVGGAPFAKTNQELSRDAIRVENTTTLHLRARNDCDVSVAFYG